MTEGEESAATRATAAAALDDDPAEEDILPSCSKALYASYLSGWLFCKKEHLSATCGYQGRASTAHLYAPR